MLSLKVLSAKELAGNTFLYNLKRRDDTMENLIKEWRTENITKNEFTDVRKRLYDTDTYFPLITHEGKYRTLDEYCPFYHLLPYTESEEWLEVGSLYGEPHFNWVFDRTIKDRGMYPRPQKLENILKGMLIDGQEVLPPIDVICVDGEYYFHEGNHRYYTCLLLGIEKIKAKIRVYEGYEEWIQQHSIIELGELYYLEHPNGQRYMINDKITLKGIKNRCKVKN